MSRRTIFAGWLLMRLREKTARPAGHADVLHELIAWVLEEMPPAVDEGTGPVALSVGGPAVAAPAEDQ